VITKNGPKWAIIFLERSRKFKEAEVKNPGRDWKTNISPKHIQTIKNSYIKNKHNWLNRWMRQQGVDDSYYES